MPQVNLTTEQYLAIVQRGKNPTEFAQAAVDAALKPATHKLTESFPKGGPKSSGTHR